MPPFSSHRPSRKGATRREGLFLGGLSALGLSLADLSRLRAAAPGEKKDDESSAVFIFLFGGPSHIDLWDMKPSAPLEVRGEFKPIATRVSGIELCEHLPLLARETDKLCLIRSMTHQMPVHGPACSQMTTGRDYFGPPTTDEARPEDWPSLSAMVTRFGHPSSSLPAAVVLPWYSQFDGQSRRIAGQTGGRMGEEFNGLLVEGDPSQPGFEIPGFRPRAGITAGRLRERQSLGQALEQEWSWTTNPGSSAGAMNQHARRAFELLADARVARAFDLSEEPVARRERYGFTKFGQSLLLARRMIEAGVRLVTVNWDDVSKLDKVSPFWDTHHQNFPKLKEQLCPVFDRAFSAFVVDLAERGLLAKTLVVATGEFGRTPKIGQFTQNAMTEKTGRDHWPHAFTSVVAGGGTRGGSVHGATNSTGGYVTEDPVTPADLSATLLEHLGIDSKQVYFDHFQRIPQELSLGRPIRAIFS